MEIRLDPGDKAPPYEQIKVAVIGLVASGELKPGFRLPPIRQLAGDLGLAPNTVARAYRELETDGFVRSRGRRGTTIVDQPTPASRTLPAIEQMVRNARSEGLDGAAIIDLVSRAIARS
jgi:GntR family transcriptional regulator